NRLIRCVCGKKIGPDPRNFNQRVSLGRNDLLIRTFLSKGHALQRIRNLFFSCDAGARKQHSMSFFLIIPGNLVLPSCPLS
ncbi:hypothetical protein M2958_26950, partial [Klebsiella pneumoniae]|nr:hypothetical protein [Klebsiella pneumoniae]